MAGAGQAVLRIREISAGMKASRPEIGFALWPCTARIRTLGTMTAPTELPSESPKDARLDLRLSRSTRALIAEAASASGTSVTDYVLAHVVPAARRDVIESRTIRLSQQGWDDFLDILDRPDSTELAALRTHDPEWGVRRR